MTAPRALQPLRILTWHVHGNYLYYLTQALGPQTLHLDDRYEFYLPVKPGRPSGYAGIAPGFPWGQHVQEVPVEKLRHLALDCILFQSRQAYLHDQYEHLTERQRKLPKIYLEHDPPREHPTDTRHPVNDPHTLLVHVTHFNELMWDSGLAPTRVIEHGVAVPEHLSYTGDCPRGLVVINMLRTRGRRLGADLFERIRQEVPLDLVGMGAEELGGIGEVPHDQLPSVLCRYRFLFNPIRYTSLGLAVCEAMMLGVPVVGLATTEMVTVVENGISGYLDTDWRRLVARMRTLIDDPSLARDLGQGAQRVARQRFTLKRFAQDWHHALQWATGRVSNRRAAAVRQPAILEAGA